jgi:hypothetical protein
VVVRGGLICFLMGSLLLPGQTSASTEIHFKPSYRLAGGELQLHPEPCDASVPYPDTRTGNLLVSLTPRYALAVDLQNIHPTETGETVYEFYSKPNGSSLSGQTCYFRVQSTASGVFLDQLASVSLQIGEGSTYDDLELQLPLFNPSAVILMRARQDVPYSKISLSADSTVLIDLTNLTDLPIVVDQLTTDPPTVPWKDLKASFSSGSTTLRLTRAAVAGGAIQLHLSPNRWQAFSTSVLPLATDKPHQTIHVTVEYFTQGGFSHTQEISIPVRFFPSFWGLALAVLFGAMLGSLIPLLFDSTRRKLGTWLNALAAAGLIAIIAWGMGIVLVSNNSEFRIMGFEIDPLQILPCALVGALVGLSGFRSVEAVKSLITNKDHAAVN